MIQQLAEMKMIPKKCLIGILLATLAFGAAPARGALTGQYLFDNNTLDSSGLARHGTAIGDPTFATGLYEGSAGAIQFNGTSQSVELPANTDFIRNAPGATLLAWIRPSAITSGAQTILTVNNADATQNAGLGAARANLQINGSQFRVLGRQLDSGGSSSFSGGAPIAGTSFLVAGVFDYTGSAVRLYVNGESVGSTTVAGWTANSADSTNLVARIGSNFNGTGEFFNGLIDGARIYNTALSASEILDIYTAEAFPGPLPGDTDGNGVVNGEDLTPIRTNWRLTGKTREEGNLSADAGGLVDFVDFRQWKTAFLGGGGSLDGLDVSFAVVPEPTSILLVLFGLAAGSLRRRSR
jgi:hypothetical protein